MRVCVNEVAAWSWWDLGSQQCVFVMMFSIAVGVFFVSNKHL